MELRCSVFAQFSGRAGDATALELPLHIISCSRWSSAIVNHLPLVVVWLAHPLLIPPPVFLLPPACSRSCATPMSAHFMHQALGSVAALLLGGLPGARGPKSTGSCAGANQPSHLSDRRLRGSAALRGELHARRKACCRCVHPRTLCAPTHSTSCPAAPLQAQLTGMDGRVCACVCERLAVHVCVSCVSSSSSGPHRLCRGDDDACNAMLQCVYMITRCDGKRTARSTPADDHDHHAGPQ